MVNISAGGVGLLIDARETRIWHLGDTFFVSFHLPDVEAEFQMMTEFRHYRRIHDGLSAVAGFRFLPWPLVSTKAQVRHILRFIAAQQRCRLRRGR